MRAIIVEEHGGPEVLRVGQRPKPTPEPTEVVIETDAAGLNFADIEHRRGTYPDEPDVTSQTPPFVPGGETAGRVVAAGEQTAYDGGERVIALTFGGAHAEYVRAPAQQVMAWPDGLTAAAAAGVPIQFFTAHNALFEWGGLTDGETVLIHAGAGGVGSAAIQLADRVECTVYATASTADKRSFIREIGGDHAIDYTDTAIDEFAAQQVPEGFDLVLDGVGGSAFKQSVSALAPGGRIVSYGMASGRIPTVAVPRLLFANRSVHGYHLDHAVTHYPERVAAAQESVLDGFERGELTVFLDELFTPDEAAKAHQRLESRDSTGKIVISFDE